MKNTSYIKLIESYGFSNVPLIICSQGGHLAEALFFTSQFPLKNPPVFLTESSEHTEDVLKNCKNKFFVKAVGKKDLLGALRVGIASFFYFFKIRPDFVLSTGAGIALFSLPIAKLFTKNVFFLESMTRPQGFSLTGKLLSKFPGIHVISRTNEEIVSLLQNIYTHKPKNQKIQALANRNQLSILVLTGSRTDLSFPSLIFKVLEIFGDKDLIVWQLPTQEWYPNLPGIIWKYMPNETLKIHIQNSDLVIAHAGVGIVLDVLESGKIPLLMARDPTKAEHVDSHQELFIQLLSESNLCINFGQIESDRDYILKILGFI